jgi:hypothetical protein
MTDLGKIHSYSVCNVINKIDQYALSIEAEKNVNLQ